MPFFEKAIFSCVKRQHIADKNIFDWAKMVLIQHQNALEDQLKSTQKEIYLEVTFVLHEVFGTFFILSKNGT